MARTRKRGYDSRGNLDPEQRPEVRSFWARERKWARKQTNRAARNAADEKLRTMTDPEDVVIDDNPSTGGWITH